VTNRKKMEGYCSTGQSPQWAVVPMEKEEEEEEEEEEVHELICFSFKRIFNIICFWVMCCRHFVPDVSVGRN
jgi:hypothetical protein